MIEYLDRLRQMDLVGPEVGRAHIHLIGCGGIGSACALLLAKIGFGSDAMGGGQFHLWDPDKVEGLNVPVQWFPRQAIGQNKAEALARQLRAYSDVVARVHSCAWEPPVDESGIYISGVDSMEARKAIWRELKDVRPRLYVDARMGAQVGIIYCVNGSNDYASTFHAAGDIVRDPCTAKSICHTPFLLASAVASLLLAFMRGEPLPFETNIDSRSRLLFAA